MNTSSLLWFRGRATSFVGSARLRVFLVPVITLGVFVGMVSGGNEADARRARTRNPHGQVKLACESCHTSTSWSPIRSKPDFEHRQTGFALHGLHENVDCRACHSTLVFAEASKNCASCHADIHRRRNGATCESCHSETGWKVSVEAVAQHQNRFPLVGGHAAADCQSCHKGAAVDRFAGLSTECASCHLEDYRTTKVVNHQAIGAGTRCNDCHSLTSWAGPRFDHATTGFQLAGGHSGVDCRSCHVSGRFTELPRDCISCHREDFATVRNPDHKAADFGEDCTACHQSAQWKGATFQHATGRFQLTGAHGAAQCSSCHVNGQYQGTSTACASCHSKLLPQTSNPNHLAAGFNADCATCHTTSGWKGGKFDHNVATKFALTGGHTAATCQQCHKNSVFKGTSTDCVSCHLETYKSAANPNHVTAGFPQNCQSCHTTIQWKGAKFDHAVSTKFPLTGAHSAATCQQCHQNNVFQGTSSECVSCHLQIYTATRNPNHSQAGFSQQCSSCHVTAKWAGAKFDHSRTKFALNGAHAAANCQSCHSDNQYAGKPADCVSCHLDQYKSAANPNHASAGFPQTCQSCHTTSGWKGAKFDHSVNAKFPLTGGHSAATCQQCHSSGVFKGTSADCVSCHLNQYKTVTNPNHVAAGFPQTCQSCHTTAGWKGAKFDHSVNAKFPLTGGHSAATCQQCHSSGVFKGTSADCVSCHLNQYKTVSSPNHVAAGFPQTCQSCHTTAGWKGAKFDHSVGAKFPLTGGHTGATCQQCHSNGVFQGTSNQCVSCHVDQYKKTTNPNHASAGFPQECATCHNTSQWSGAQFDHTTTRFPLKGAHVSVSCSSCHSSGAYAGTATDCVSCHLSDYSGTTTPSHSSLGFPRDCTVCHTANGWAGAQFDHSATSFPLTGGHTAASCASCHRNNQYVGTARTCESCHLSNYSATRSPDHTAAGFPRDCSVCHATTGWAGAKFDHSVAKFKLTGAHTGASCSNCHSSGQFAGLDSRCVACHQNNFNSAQNPNHGSAGFPTDCQVCHSPTGWRPTTFSHANTGFSLTGAHTSAACAKCHVNGRYAGTPRDCYSCHRSEYTTVTSPNHAAAGFPQTCANCHSTNTWSGATFNHKFPIYGEPHRGKWDNCSNCHTNSSNYAAFSCFGCHVHEKSRMDDKHKENRNYVYNSANCYSCHPQGKN